MTYMCVCMCMCDSVCVCVCLCEFLAAIQACRTGVVSLSVGTAPQQHVFNPSIWPPCPLYQPD